jgi:hypothetical protein
MSLIHATQEAEKENHSPRLFPAKALRPYLKNKVKRAGRCGSNDRTLA